MIKEGALNWNDIVEALKMIEPSSKAKDLSATNGKPLYQLEDSHARFNPRIYPTQSENVETGYRRPPPQLVYASTQTNPQVSSQSKHMNPGNTRPLLLPYNPAKTQNGQRRI